MRSTTLFVLLAAMAIVACANTDITELSQQAALALKGEQLLENIKAATCAYGGHDFSVLTQTASDYTFKTADGHYVWYYNMCANTIKPCEGDSKKSNVVWNYDYAQPYACFNLADPTTGVWSQGSGYISAKYTGGDSCYNVVPASTYSFELQIKCDPGTKGALTGVTQGKTQCDWIGSFSSSLACGGSSASAGSAGAWAFVGLALGLPVLYAAGGFVYNAKVRGKEGVERWPNYMFWADFPYLLKDGCYYFVYLIKLSVSKCRGTEAPELPPLSSPGASISGSASQGSYGTI